jgi:hypothetical protein
MIRSVGEIPNLTAPDRGCSKREPATKSPTAARNSPESNKLSAYGCLS